MPAFRTASATSAPPAHALAPPPTGPLRRLAAWCVAAPMLSPAGSVVALLARFSIAGVFWRSGQTKVEGLAVDLVDGRAQVGWPRLSSSAVDLFRDEYALPLLPPEAAALMATAAEHLLPAMVLLGVATRLGATGLLAMTAVIQFLVYPGAWTTHGVWAAVLLGLMLHGPGALSLDALWARRRA